MKLLDSTIHNISKYADCCHVGQSNREVVQFAISKLKQSVWKTVDLPYRKKLYRALIKRHQDNIGLYDSVMMGRF